MPSSSINADATRKETVLQIDRNTTRTRGNINNDSNAKLQDNKYKRIKANYIN